MSAFDKQQTIETIRANLDLRQANWDHSTVDYEQARAADRVEKLRKAKIRQINAWRRKAGKHT